MQRESPIEPFTRWPLHDIQGFIIRGYGFPFVRYFPLSVAQPAAARAFLAAIAPQVTSAAPWGVKPATCLNIGFTWRGLQALGLPQTSLDSFQNDMNCAPFVAGSAASAQTIGDVGPSAPGGWRVDDRGFDVMLVLHAQTMKALEAATTALAKQFKAGFGPLDRAQIYDTQNLDNGKIYFGYRDGIAQPQIAGSPFYHKPDGGQPPADPGSVMLGEAGAGSGFESVTVPQPAVLGHYGTYAAFRMLRQDVEGFEAQIARLAPAFGKAFGITDPHVQREALKAKLCGRWTNGAPLAAFPINGNKIPDPPPLDKLNQFDYDPLETGGPPDQGQGCPVGAHIRRGNPRDSRNVNSPRQHRILRRAHPYQQPYDPKNRNTGERGLMGLFVGASLYQQFEFIMRNWINSPSGFGPTTDVACPLLGTNLAAGPIAPRQERPAFRHSLPTSQTDRATALSVESFIQTQGSAYLFFPSIPGLGWIGALPNS